MVLIGLTGFQSDGNLMQTGQSFYIVLLCKSVFWDTWRFKSKESLNQDSESIGSVWLSFHGAFPFLLSS